MQRARTKKTSAELCRAEFSCRAPAATSVSLVGCFNNWDVTAGPLW
jgi:hypothetical protein